MSLLTITETWRADVKRNLVSAVAPCSGWVSLRDAKTGDHRSSAGLPLDHVGFGDEIEVTISVRVVKRGRPSRRRCHNPWPAHIHDDGSRKRRRPRTQK